MVKRRFIPGQWLDTVVGPVGQVGELDEAVGPSRMILRGRSK